MEPTGKTKAKLGVLLAGLAAAFVFVIFLLARHPETAVLLVSLPGPAALACNLRCLGVAPFLQVLGEGAKTLLLIFFSSAFIYALFRSVRRVQRTWSFVERVEKKAVSAGPLPGHHFLESVTVFEDPMPLAFTGGFLRPRIYISTKLMESLDAGELRAVVLHERHHLESKDPLKSLSISFISDFLFFLPVSRFLKKAYHLTSEMTADARSIGRNADPLDLAGSLLKVQRLGGPAASWFFDPATERAKHILGEPATIPLPLKRIFVTLVFLAVSTVIILVPVRKNVTSMFIAHDKTCVLNSGRK